MSTSAVAQSGDDAQAIRVAQSVEQRRPRDGGPCSTTEVTTVVSVSRQAATKHLLLLEAVGLVSSQRHGRERIWRVQPKPLTEASEYLTALSQRWDRAIDRLRAYIEEE